MEIYISGANLIFPDIGQDVVHEWGAKYDLALPDVTHTGRRYFFSFYLFFFLATVFPDDIIVSEVHWYCLH